MDKVIKDVGDIQSRMLDHRPVVQGEIRYFVREFEEKRGYRDSRLLENLNRTLLEATEQLVPCCQDTMQQHLCEVLMRLEAAKHTVQRIQQRELEAQESGRLQAHVDARRQDWEEFTKEQARLKEEVDEEHAKAVGRLSAHYGEMKKELTRLAQL